MTDGDRLAAALRPGLAARLGLFIGPALALLVACLPLPEGLERGGMLVAAVLVLMAVWWATEAIPIAVTSLLPLGLLPLTGVASLKDIAAPYADHVVLLLLGGFMLATGLLSMWISNTATSLMMAPIALSVAVSAGGGPRLASALLLGIAYSASIGGLATPVGTPTNLIAMGWLGENAGIEISFREWMTFGLPIVLVMLPMAWLILTWGLRSDAEASRAAEATVREQHSLLGRMTTPEARIAAVFGLVALAWVTREQLVHLPLLGGLTDMGIAILGAIVMFLVPHGSREPADQAGGWALLSWEDARAVPWDVVLLFGGGLSLAAAVQASGLAGWLGTSLAGLAAVPPIILILCVVTIIIFLTEIMSNVAAMTTFLPVLGALSAAIGIDPRSLIIPCAMAASCAFMLPIATGPNAVVFGMRQFSIGRMMKSGFLLNIACVLIVTLYFGL